MGNYPTITQNACRVAIFRRREKYLFCHGNKKRWDFPLGNRPTPCRWRCVTFMGRSSALPTILHVCKGKHCFWNCQTFLVEICEKWQSVPRNRTEKVVKFENQKPLYIVRDFVSVNLYRSEVMIPSLIWSAT